MSTSGDPREPDQPTGNLSDELPAELFEPEPEGTSQASTPAQKPTRELSERAQSKPARGDRAGDSGAPDPAGPESATPGTGPSDRARKGAEAGRGMSGGAWGSLIAGAIVLILLLIFILQNNTATQSQYFGWHFSLPLGVAMLLAAIAGVLVAGIVGSVRIFILQRRLKKFERALQR